jgi:hypothetical protein
MSAHIDKAAEWLLNQGLPGSQIVGVIGAGTMDDLPAMFFNCVPKEYHALTQTPEMRRLHRRKAKCARSP